MRLQSQAHTLKLFIIMETPEIICSAFAHTFMEHISTKKIYPDLPITYGVKLMTEICNAYRILQDAFNLLHSEYVNGN